MQNYKHLEAWPMSSPFGDVLVDLESAVSVLCCVLALEENDMQYDGFALYDVVIYMTSC
jgi:hypothetical protein